jgi:hypothetical protein
MNLFVYTRVYAAALPYMAELYCGDPRRTVIASRRCVSLTSLCVTDQCMTWKMGPA